MSQPAGRCRCTRALLEGSKTAAAAIGIYLLAVPFLLVAGLGVVIFFLASAFVLGREYFDLAAMRHLSPLEARQLRAHHHRTVLLAGALIAAFVAIPIVNLATPLFGTALMVHVYKRLSGGTARIRGTEPADRRRANYSITRRTRGCRAHSRIVAVYEIPSTVFAGHLQRSAITQDSQSGRRATQT